jgi:hypothetical protein
MNYVVVIKELSNGSLDRSITPYADNDTALRKFHEAFNTIGGGPKRISSVLMQDAVNLVNGTTYELVVVKNETWVQEPEPTPNE